MTKSTCQFFYLRTGNGHLAPAKALANELKQKHGNKIEPMLVDGLSQSQKLAKKILIDGYSYSINKAKWLYEFLYALHKIRFVSHFSSFIVCLLTYKHVEKKIIAHKPDKIVILHFFLIAPILKVLNKHNLKTETTIIVTDPFTAHPIWFYKKEQKYIVFSDKLKKELIEKKLARNENISVFPFIIDEKYTVKLSESEKREAKIRLGFTVSKKIILIIGGGHGIPNGVKIALRVARENPEAEIAFVCGHNKSLYKRILHLKIDENLENIKLYGYVDFVHTLLNISDLVVTKCGASTFMEILFSEKVQIICNYIWEQEKGNMEFVRNNQMGVYQKSISKLSLIAKDLLSNNQMYATFQQNIRKQSFHNGTSSVVSFLVGQ